MFHLRDVVRGFSPLPSVQYHSGNTVDNTVLYTVYNTVDNSEYNTGDNTVHNAVHLKLLNGRRAFLPAGVRVAVGHHQRPDPAGGRPGVGVQVRPPPHQVLEGSGPRGSRRFWTSRF